MKKVKNDIILVAFFLLVAVGSYVVMFMANTTNPSYALITVDGKEEKRLGLDEDSEYVVTCETGKNIVKVEDGSVSVIEADCPDGLCKKQGKISKTGETIVCLPNKVVVTVRGDEESGIDAVAE